MNIKIQKTANKDSKYFPIICEWQANWWGANYKSEKVAEYMSRFLNEDKIPQTYIALYGDNVVGMYQIAMDDGVDIRPDYYPWLVNVYVDEKYRGKGIFNDLMNDAKNRFKQLGIKKIYLYTEHKNLYEKYDWKYLEEVETLTGKIRKLYYLDINY